MTATTTSPARPARGERASRSATPTPPSCATSTCRSRTARSPSSSAPTRAASPRCCAGLARLLRPRVGRGAARRRGDPPAADQAGRPHARPAAAEPDRPRGRHRRRPRRPRPPPAPRRLPPLDQRGRGGRRRGARAHRHARASPTASSTSSPAASASGCGSRWPSRRAPTCCCSTSRRPTSTSPTRSRCSTCSPSSTPGAAPRSSWCCTTSTSPPATPTTSSPCATGRIVAEGTPREVVTEEVVRTVFGLDNRVIDDPVSHTPLVVPVGRQRHPHRPPPTQPGEPMTVTAIDVLPMLLAEVEVVVGRAAQPDLRPRRARRPRARPTSASTGRATTSASSSSSPTPSTGGITSTEGADESWWSTWLERPASRARPHAHLHDPRRPRLRRPTRPSSSTWCCTSRATSSDRARTWASRAARRATGSCCSRRGGASPTAASSSPPGPGADLLLVGDETAVPAVCTVLEQLPDDARGDGVPRGARRRPTSRTYAVRRASRSSWLAREGDELGARPARRGGGPPRASPARRSRSRPTRWTPTCGRRRSTPPPARRCPGDVVTGFERHLRLDRGGVQGRHRPAPPPGQRARLRPQPGRLHGLLAPRCRDEVLTAAASAAAVQRRLVRGARGE